MFWNEIKNVIYLYVIKNYMIIKYRYYLQLAN